MLSRRKLNVPIVTERLTLRPFERSDRDALFALHSDHECFGRMTGLFALPPSVESAAKVRFEPNQDFRHRVQMSSYWRTADSSPS